MTNRPAEKSGIGAGIAGLVAIILGNPSEELTAVILAIVAVVPAVVTFWVANGGLAGIKDLFLRGRGNHGA